MKRILVLIVTLSLFASAAFAASSSKGYAHLTPGATANLAETLPVNFVFVGYEPDDVDVNAFLAALPQEYKPVIRSRLWYGVTELLGIHYTFDYRAHFTDAAYEDRFFGMLSANAQPANLTIYQQWYNDQAGNVRDLADNHYIDAPTVEKWLAQNPPAGVNTAQNTVFFINWWGNGATPRAGFKNHVYTKIGEPDPDTGYDFGLNRDSRKLIAWGGTTANDEETGLGSTHRIWFHDLSAGPEGNTDNWNVDNPDLDGDGVVDYRMPPVWEYFTPGGFRTAADLTGDLARVARYGAINLLFTPSPLYPPAITPNLLPDSINLDFNTYEDLKKTDASGNYQKPDLTMAELGEQFRVTFTADNQDLKLDGEAKNCYLKFLQNLPCYNNHPEYPAFANLYLYHALNRDQFADGGAPYEGMFFNYATDEKLGSGFLGFADDNWYDGTQSFTFNFIDPGIIAAGYGLTTTQIHEFGHHMGMSHPHDGYDWEQNIDYGPDGEFYFAWIGDEVNSMMSYIDVNWDYSQFDQDNANRFRAAAFITNANGIAADVLASPNAGAASGDLAAADAAIGAAKQAMANHDYAGAYDHAKVAYDAVMAGAAKADVTVEIKNPNGWYVMPPSRGKGHPKKKEHSFVDKIGPGSHRSKP